MKIQCNLTDSRYDLERFSSPEDLREFLKDFDGIELMHLEDDPSEIIPRDLVTGCHMTQPEYWLDFWRENLAACLREFGTYRELYAYYGENPANRSEKTPEDPKAGFTGSPKKILINKIRREFETALSYGAEYAVIHVSDASIFEEITGTYHYSDRDVIDGFCELMNSALPESFDGPWLLMENLWQPGLNFSDPQMTARLMEKIRYPKKGIMLDTGHLMHTDPSLRSQKEAVRFIHRKLDEHGELCRFIKGVHLHQSLTGTVLRKYHRDPPKLADTYAERTGQLFDYIFRVDQHRPFTADGVSDLIKRIAPDYLTFEFISQDLAQHRKMLKRQWAALSRTRPE